MSYELQPPGHSSTFQPYQICAAAFEIADARELRRLRMKARIGNCLQSPLVYMNHPTGSAVFTLLPALHASRRIS
jgi:hypothetical protein